MGSSMKMPSDITKVRTTPVAGAGQSDSTATGDAFSGILNTVTGKQPAAKQDVSKRDATNPAHARATDPRTRANAASREAARDSSAASRTSHSDAQNEVHSAARQKTQRQSDRDEAASTTTSDTSQVAGSVTESTTGHLDPNQDQQDTTASTTLADPAAELLLMMGMGQVPAAADSASSTVSTAEVAASGAVTQNIAGGANAATGASDAMRAMVSAEQGAGQSFRGAGASASAANEATTPTASVASISTTSQKETELSGMAAFMTQMTTKTEQKETTQADMLVNTANLLAAIGNSGTAAGTQSVKDMAAALQTNQHTLNERVGSPAWTQELGSKLVVLSKQDVSAATLHVTPADLGPMRIHIETQQNQANVWFAADHPETRSAIEQSLPRLREMFVAQGMQLNDAGVSGQSSQQQPTSTPSGWRNTPEMGEMETPDTVTVRTLSLKLVDAYA